LREHSNPSELSLVPDAQVRRRDEPNANSPQLASTANGAAPNGIAYEPVRSYKKPAAAGPSAAPHRQPRLSTPRIAPRARVPNTSGTALASIVSAAAKPTPSTTSDARRASSEERPRSARSAMSCSA